VVIEVWSLPPSTFAVRVSHEPLIESDRAPVACDHSFGVLTTRRGVRGTSAEKATIPVHVFTLEAVVDCHVV
jgi:hypothetical protein